jgi:TIR domain
MATIVISYRRDDSKWIAGRIYDRLENHYGNGNVFMDIDSIPFGLDFRDHIRETLDRCDVLVALVGPNWMGKDQTKENILDETDWVRIEIEAALNKKIPVIPVLIDRSQMPKPGELPDGLKSFAFRQAARIDTENFHSNMDRVIAAIDKHFLNLGEAPIKSTVPQNAGTKAQDAPLSIQMSANAPQQLPDPSQVIGAETISDSVKVSALILGGLTLIFAGWVFFNYTEAPFIFGILMIVMGCGCLIGLIPLLLKLDSQKARDRG